MEQLNLSQVGSWKDSSISYDYIFTGDTGMDIDEYLYDNEVTITDIQNLI
jgi:hypothetical protein